MGAAASNSGAIAPQLTRATLRRKENGRDTREGALPLLPSGPGGVHVPALSRPKRDLTPPATERVGFEPTIRFPVCTRSRRVPSTARPPLQQSRFERRA